MVARTECSALKRRKPPEVGVGRAGAHRRWAGTSRGVSSHGAHLRISLKSVLIPIFQSLRPSLRRRDVSSNCRWRPSARSNVVGGALAAPAAGCDARSQPPLPAADLPMRPPAGRVPVMSTPGLVAGVGDPGPARRSLSSRHSEATADGEGGTGHTEAGYNPTIRRCAQAPAPERTGGVFPRPL